ncbi:unnamed protein product [Auanema sp. JU1783]|nr:unnamed protein product [Auanema sp. JU1783]
MALICFIFIRGATNINFRCNILMLCLGDLLVTLNRTYTLVLTMAGIANRADLNEFQGYMGTDTFGKTIAQVSFISLVYERMVASYFTSSYEKLSKKINCLICVLSILTIVACSFLYTAYHPLGFTSFIIESSTILFETMIVFALLYYNKYKYDNRHQSMLKLSDRYQIQENVRTTKYILPATIIQIIHTLVQLVFFFYVFFILGPPQSPGKLGMLQVTVDLPASIYRMVLYSYLFSHHRTYQRLKDGFTRSISPLSAHDTTKNHFKDLKNMWK